MREDTLSCERAVVAFCRRANAIGKNKTKGVTQEFYDEAVRAAKLVDEKNRDNSEEGGGSAGGNDGDAATGTTGLLHGMPMSIKDAMHMKGAVRTGVVSGLESRNFGISLVSGGIHTMVDEHGGLLATVAKG